MDHNKETCPQIMPTLTRLRQQLPDYLQLIRFDRPIGTMLLLWPTLWALWLAAKGIPDIKLLLIFIAGTFLMRSAGCVINDYADRNIDGQVKRTVDRPLAAGRIAAKDALYFCLLLCLLAFILVLFTNGKTLLLSVVAVLLAGCYPFMKRYTHFPQLVLGAAFAWSIPMAFAAQSNELPPALWLLYAAVLLWTTAYDTFYAMVDRDDDINIGMKSTAILFGRWDRVITALIQCAVIVLLVLLAPLFQLGTFYYGAVVLAAGLFIYQQKLIRRRERDQCFKAFLHNQWVGAVIFAGIFFHYQFQ